MSDRTTIKKIALACFVALVTFLVYLPSLRNDFVFWDDDQYIFENDHIRSLGHAFFKWAFFDFYASNWHPLTWISHGLDYALWGLNPAGHHLTNNILHAINTFLVVMLAIHLAEYWKVHTTSKFAAFFNRDRAIFITGGVTGILFGLHPVHVESVAWVSERKDLLCAFFFLLGIHAYVKYFRTPDAEASPIRRMLLNRQYWFALGFFMLALLSKPMAVSFPVVLLILDGFLFGRIRSLKTFWFALVEKLPFIALSGFSSLVTISAQRGAMQLTEMVPLQGRLIMAAQAVIAYLRHIALPLELLPYYPYPHEISLLFPPSLLSMLFVIGITILCIALKRRFWLSVWSYYLVTLLPVLGILQVGSQAMADRYLYLPSVGPFLAIGAVLTVVSERYVFSEKRGITVRGFWVVLALVTALTLSFLTVRQIGIWKNGITLWSFVIEREAEQVPFAFQNRGDSYLDAGQFDKALADLNTAVALDAGCVRCYYLRGLTLYDMNRFREAIADFDKTLALDPQYWEAFLYRNQALNTIGQGPPAEHDPGTAGRSDPGRQ